MSTCCILGLGRIASLCEAMRSGDLLGSNKNRGTQVAWNFDEERGVIPRVSQIDVDVYSNR